ncbi:Nacht domain [Fusarium albosuccineum]|uniref:Nacht domain n=1 Tax=Fusarium albosuccineum TaxID=1237068 RepID=A0A8H4PB79_9HYPO|nr:Nacht domain [Fusarium albosuccineum]
MNSATALIPNPAASATTLAIRDESAPYPMASFSALSAALLTQSMREPYADWYLGNPRGRWSNPAKNAYDSAIKVLKKELTLDECQAIWLRDHASMADVQDALSAAQQEYQNRVKGSRVRKWLSSCASRVTHYGIWKSVQPSLFASIFDVFVQHHPEYVSLAWGTFKFLFIAVVNHEELLAEISKAISRIADVLPRTELHSTLYPTDRIQEAVSMVYAKIIEFSIAAIKWYKKNKFMHAILSIIKPFSLSFKDIIDEVSDWSRRVDKLASAAAKAEIRGLHVDVHGLRERIHQLTELMHTHQTLQSQIMVELRDQKQFFRNSQIEDMRNVLLLEDTPLPDKSLTYCVSLRNRRRRKMPIQLPAPEILKLKQWLSDPSSSLLLAEGQGVRTSSVDFATDFINAVLEKEYPILWVLPSSNEQEESSHSIKGILRSLVMKALDLNPGAVSNGVNPIRMQHLRNIVAVDQWFKILERCLASIPRVFMVIDMRSVEMAVDHDEDEGSFFKASDFVQRVSEMVHNRMGGGLKVVIVSWRFKTVTSLEANELFGEEQIFTDAGRRMQRLMRQPKYKAEFKRRNVQLVKRFKSTMEVLNT